MGLANLRLMKEFKVRLTQDRESLNKFLSLPIKANQNYVKYITLPLLIIFFLASCVAELENFKSPVGKSFFTVEGGISNQAGPHSLSLYLSSPEIQNSSIRTPVQNAKVYVQDDSGIKIDFKEVSLGFYQTADNVRGVVGKTYKLFIEADGKKYESTPEKMPEAPVINKLYYESSLKENLLKTDPNRGGFDVFIDFNDSPKSGEYYRWGWKNYSKVLFCSLCRRVWDDRLNRCDESNLPGFSQRIVHYCRQNCWDITYGDRINIISDVLANGQTQKKILVHRVPNLVDESYAPTFEYYVQVELMKITANTYRNFRVLQEQSQNNGTFFDVPALTQFNINVKCLTDPNENVLGVFDVYASQRQVVYVRRGEQAIGDQDPIIKRRLQALECNPSPCYAPCVESLYRTRTTPEGWKF
jgi:hypothetical protein